MITFGTSGFRGIIGDNFTKENVRKIAYSIAKNMKTDDVVPIGYDNRFMGKEFAIWVSEVLVFYGKKIKFFEIPVPSSLIAYETINLEYGIHITASHNPYFYNGIKIFQRRGRETTKEQNDVFAKISNKIKPNKIGSIDFEEAIAKKIITKSKNINPYCNAIIKLVNKKTFENSKLNILYNAMNGSATACADIIFSKLGINVSGMNTEVNPYFTNGIPAPYEKNLLDQKERIKKEKFSFGFALDGDGDRVSFVDENGDYYDCNYISSLIYDYYLTNKKLKFDFVKNCAMTSLLEEIAKKNQQKVLLAKVGFKNIAEKMIENDGILVGAESNGIALKSHILHKDGLACAVVLSEILAESKKSLGEMIKLLKKKYKYPCEVVEYAYPFNKQQREYIENLVFKNKQLPKSKYKIIATSYEDGLKIYYENGYWGVMRFSGNEDVIRLFSEMPTRKEAEDMIKVYEKFIGLKIKQ